MKILILFSHEWRGGRAGGAETHAVQLMKELAGKGHEIYFVASGDGCAATKPEGVLAEYRLPFQSLNPFDKVATYKRLREIVEKHGIEIVHAHHRTGGYFAECLFRSTGVPYVITVHDVWHQAPFKRLHGRIFRRLIAVSGFMKAALMADFGVAEDRVRVIHNGVDPARFEKVGGTEVAGFREKFGIGNEVVFSLVGRVVKAKGHFDVIEALRRLPAELDYRLLIVGEGKDKRKLQDLVVLYGLGERVVFCGYRADIPVVMKASDVVLLPSHRELFGLTIVEGMLAGKAVLASDAGGIPEVVTHDRDGLLFPVRDVAALADGIRRLALDEGLRRRLGEEGERSVLSRFLLSKMIEETEGYYSEIVGSC